MATSRQTRRGRAAYERLFEQREREGWSFSELSERSGVPIGTLWRWGRRFRREAAAAASEPFLEIVASPAAAPVTRVEVLLRSGRTISVPAARPFDGLGELVALLERC